LLEQATEQEYIDQYTREVDDTIYEIRYINTRIGDEKQTLQDAQNGLDHMMAWDADVVSQQEFDSANNDLITLRVEKRDQMDNAQNTKGSLEGQIEVL
jgi:hypothetical protein